MRILLIFFIMIQMYTNINGQNFKIGVSGIRSTPHLLFEKLSGGKLINESQFTYQIEVHALKNFYNQNAISIGFIYSPNRFDLSKSPIKLNSKLTSFSIPILLNLQIYKNFRFELGGQVNINRFKPNRTWNKIYDSSIRCGINYKFDIGVYVFSYYNYSLSPINKISRSYGLNSLALGAGYSF